MPMKDAPVEFIDDPADPRLDDYRDLVRSDRRPDRPGGKGLVIAEGVSVVERMARSPYPMRSIMGVAERVEAAIASITVPADVPVYVVEPSTMDAAIGFHLNRGVLAIADRAPMPQFAELVAASRSLLVLEGVNDHENLGGLFRNAAAFGVDGVVIGPRCSDPLYRRAVRVSMGHVLKVPYVDAPQWPQALYEIEASGFAMFALTPYPPAVDLSHVGTDVDRVAVVVGAEGAGLSDAALAAVRRHARIPMADGVDSLNVATAAAIALNHFRRSVT
ncbi:tRNA G18 (ribose-2'-O)-methylase SpoU [Antricoccus suffuscus]|uniref:tRNA G18 (Ribose-2'-O)-methylase SpoU n=1 Tax=Antricoccus suffuscus TaxID=1629062 RepID=A0A2T0ZY19_9ACTN|nr:RNA methyltransferase [Antricoccus suffuscus]PRZ41137.1 tRNA G18 (ribose-2'-O)-methylase SpoU [Antricoccus suffuscus]